MMRDAITAAVLVAGIFLSFAIQPFIPPLHFAADARVFLMPVLFCAGACILPYPYMLLLAVVGGLMTDLVWLQITGPTVEISVGWTILLLVAFGSICQGVRSLVLQGQWWWPALLSAGTTLAILLTQFLGLTMKRFDSGGLVWNETAMARMLVPAVVALLLSLLLHAVYEFFESGFSHRRPLREF